MSKSSLPDYVNPRRLAAQGMTLEGQISANSFKRIAEVATITTDAVDVTLKFFSDEENYKVISGTVEVELDLDCQRCLSPVTVKVYSDFEVVIVASDESAKNIPKHYEPVIVEEDTLELVPLIEEELLLALPMHAYHDHCDVQMSFGEADMDAAEVEETTPNPFQVLANLKVGKSKN
jgi:uncharacterized protein